MFQALQEGVLYPLYYQEVVTVENGSVIIRCKKIG